MINKLLLLTVFLIPLIGAQGAFGYEHIKVLFFIIFISLISLLWIFTKPDIKWTSISKAASLFILVLLITSLTGSNLKISLLGTPVYFQGWILYAYLFLFYLLVKSLNIKLKYWALILILSSVAVSVFAIKDWILINYFNQHIPTYADRVVSSFGQPNLYSGFILMTMPMLLSLQNVLKGYWVLDMWLSLITGIVISGSRAAILISAGLMIFWLSAKMAFKKLLLVVLGAVILITVIVSATFSSGLFFKEVQEPWDRQWLIENSPEKRVYIWPVIGELISKRPLLGYGLENLGDSYSLYFRSLDFNSVKNPSLYSLKDLFVDRSHNYILDLLMFAGILGLLSWLILLWQLFRNVKSQVLLMSLVIYLIWVQFQNQSVVHLIYFWLLVGLIDGT